MREITSVKVLGRVLDALYMLVSFKLCSLKKSPLPKSPPSEPQLALMLLYLVAHLCSITLH